MSAGRLEMALEWALAALWRAVLCVWRTCRELRRDGRVSVVLDGDRELVIDVARSLEVYAHVRGAPEASWWRFYHGGLLWGELRDSSGRPGFSLWHADFAGGLPVPLPLALLAMVRPGEDEPEWLSRFACRVWRSVEDHVAVRRSEPLPGWEILRTGPWWNLGLEVSNETLSVKVQVFPTLGLVFVEREGVGCVTGGPILGLENPWRGAARPVFTPWALARVLLGRP